MTRRLTVLVLLAGFACGTPPPGGSRPSSVGPSLSPPPSWFRLSIEGPAQIYAGDAASYRAVLINVANGSRRDVSQEAQWTSSNPAVMSMARGTAVGLASGQTTVDASYEGWKGSSVVYVYPIDTGPSAATLVIEGLSVLVTPDKLRFSYLVRFRLRETGGESGATVGDILVSGAGESQETGPACWRDSLRVPPGGTLSTFETDEGLEWLLYCAPGSGGTTPTPTLRVTVHFTDDSGRTGTAQADVTAAK